MWLLVHVCDDARDYCVSREQQAACDGKLGNEACSYGAFSGACYGGFCQPVVCGNGFREVGEACDDANLADGDGCSADCLWDETCATRSRIWHVARIVTMATRSRTTDATHAAWSHRPGASSVLGTQRVRGRTVMFGGVTNVSTFLNDTWTFRFEPPESPLEGCLYSLDGDGDTQIGCADPDCFATCTPLCNPILTKCDESWQRCGDLICDANERPRGCPMDCPAPPVTCGDFLCESPETPSACPGDCTP